MTLNGRENYEDIQFTKCRELHDVFVVRKKYKSLTNNKLYFKELNDYPIILQSKTANTRKFLDNVMSEHNIFLKPNIELASYSLVVQFTKIGFGIGYVTLEYIKKNLIMRSYLF